VINTVDQTLLLKNIIMITL